MTPLQRQKRARLRGLYAITDSNLTPEESLLEQVEAALKGGTAIIQYRDKSTDHKKRLLEATELRGLCERYNACFIINDDPQLAIDVKAHGVHLGLTDSPLSKARDMLGEQAIIGATCHGDIANAHQAIKEGADYVAFGRFFASKTKPGAAPANLEDIAPKLATLSVPCVAIGGITIANAPQLRAAGFDMLAVVGDVFSQTDITVHCKRYATLFQD